MLDTQINSADISKQQAQSSSIQSRENSKTSNLEQKIISANQQGKEQQVNNIEPNPNIDNVHENDHDLDQKEHHIYSQG